MRKSQATNSDAERNARASDPSGDAQRGCILLFGMPRSGTTWLGKLFDSHPDTLYRHEPDTWQRPDMPRYLDLAQAEEYTPALRAFTQSLPDINALRVAGKLPVFAKSYLSAARLRLMQAGIWTARAGSRLYREFPVLMHGNGPGHPQRRVVWKSIESLGRMGVLLAALDDARAIQILRHPCGYISSVLRGMSDNAFSHKSRSSEDYGIFSYAIDTPLGASYDLSMAYFKSITPEERLAWRWVLSNEKALLECGDNPSWMAIRYEDVCNDPAAGVERMFAFTGLAMNEQTRAFIAASTSSSRSDYYSVFKNPQESAWRWREELDADVIERVLAILRVSRLAAYYPDTEAADSGPVAERAG